MANPGGMFPPTVRHDVAPLFPRQHLQPVDDPKRERDLQVWPRTLRETHELHSLHRTAPVKHHLRGMAERGEMLSTYEHDFGVMKRPNFKGRSTSFGASWYGTDGKASTAHRDMMRAASQSASMRLPGPKAWELPSGDEDDVRSIKSERSRLRDHSSVLGPNTVSKMHAMRRDNDPMRLTVNGWGDQRWSTKSHPSMIQGMSSQRMNLQQAAHLMNLRAPDVPFSFR